MSVLPIGHRVRPQDADPPGLLQQGLLVPGGRLPLLPHRRSGGSGQSRDRPRRPRGAARAGAAGAGHGLRRAHDGHRRHRRGDGEPGAGHGGAHRRPARARPRPDRPLAEGRPGGVRPADLARAARLGDARRPRGASTSTWASTCWARRPTRTSWPPPAERTVAVVSTSAVPTGRMVLDPAERFPELAAQLDRIGAVTRREHNLYLDAQELSEHLFGDHMMTNTLVLGAAFSAALLPVSADALEQAIRLNGAAVEKNLAAFAWGRAVVAAPDAVDAKPRGQHDSAVPAQSSPSRELALVSRRWTATAASCGAWWRRAFPSSWPTRTGRTPPLRRAGAARAGGRAGADARARRAGRGGGPQPLQADGLQGRVRGRPTCTSTGSSEPA